MTDSMQTTSAADLWPALDWQQWHETADTLHMLTQIVGKTRLDLTPVQNHWWNVTLYVTARGLSTFAMPMPDGDHCSKLSSTSPHIRSTSAAAPARTLRFPCSLSPWPTSSSPTSALWPASP